MTFRAKLARMMAQSGGHPQDIEGLGTKLERVIARIPGIKRLPCYGPDGRLKPDSGCGKRRAWLDGTTPTTGAGSGE